jgi:flagellar FliL protein
LRNRIARKDNVAKAEAKTAKGADGDAKPAKKGRSILLIAAALVVLGGGGGGAYLWLNRDAGTAQASVAPRPPVFMNLEPFTVNLAEESGDHYLQTSLVFQVADDKVVETMKQYLPVIRNRILLLLSAKRPSDIATPEGKAKLVSEVTAAVRESIPGTTPERGIVQAFIGAFVIQ